MYGRASPVTESAVVDTSSTTTSATSSPVTGGDRMRPLGEGRVGKAARRRSRASRKTPTTVLNTDTTNFRAMVQQFTGVPTVPFQGGYPHMADGGLGSGAATLSFGIAGGSAQLYQRQAGFPLGVAQPQQQHLQFQQHHERPLFTLGGAGGSRDVYLRGFPGNRERGGMDAAEGLFLESIPPTHVMSRPAGSTDGTTTNRFLL